MSDADLYPAVPKPPDAEALARRDLYWNTADHVARTVRLLTAELDVVVADGEARQYLAGRFHTILRDEYCAISRKAEPP